MTLVLRLCASPILSLLAVTLLSIPALGAGEDPILSTLMQVKSLYKAKRWDDASAALRRLSELAAAPEREAVRPRILPAYHFYAAALAWERKDEARAKEELQRFFSFQPDASIDPSAYPKSFRIFFEAQRTEAAKLAPPPPVGPDSTAGGVLPPYATRDVDPSTIPSYTGSPDWIEGPVRHLLTDQEKKAFRGLADDDARREFVGNFWRKLDSRPDTPENEYETEFYRRVQYADANFSTEQTRGALSDRGMVFLILGPPSYVGRTGLRRSQDVMNILRTTEVVIVPSLTGGAGLYRVPSNRGSVTPGEIEGEVETWYYRRDRIPAGVPFNELQYLFVTRRGYGDAVLQKEARELTALRKAARLLKHERE